MIRLVTAILLSGLGMPAVAGIRPAQGCMDAAASVAPARPDVRPCDKALADDRLSPGDRVATLVNRGIVRMKARQYLAAIADFDAAIAVDPAGADAYVNKGIALVRIGDRDAEAVAQLSAGIDRQPGRPEIAYFSRAMAWEGLGRTREAYEDYSRAARIAPDWSEPAAQLQRFTTTKRPTASG